MSIFDFFQRKKEQRKNTKCLKNLADKWGQERKEKEEKIAEKLIPVENISILLFKEKDKLSEEMRIFEINKNNRFDKFIPVIKAGGIFHEMKGLEKAEICYTTNIKGYDLSNYNFLGPVDIQLRPIKNQENSYYTINLKNNNISFFKFRVPDNLQHIVDDINNGYVKVKDILEIFNSIEKTYLENYKTKLKSNPSIVKKYQAHRFIDQIKRDKVNFDKSEPIM